MSGPRPRAFALVTRHALLVAVGMGAALSVPPSSWARPGEREPGDPAEAAVLRRHGLECGYNLDHRDALAAFKAAIDADPEDPTAYELAAGSAWIHVLFEQGSITVDDYLGQARATLSRPKPSAALDVTFRSYLQQALQLSERRLQEAPDDAGAHFQVGAAYGFLASYTATVEGRVMGSLGPARRAYQEHERALELDPGRHDAGLIVGMYRYAVAGLPAPMRLVARLAGFGGNRAYGLRLVEEAARHPSDVQANALFTLIVIYNREARYDEALRVITELQRRFPRNRLLWLEAGNTLLRAGRAADARAAIEAGLEALSSDLRPRAFGEEARWKYAHGAALVALRQIDRADRELRAALDAPARDWVRGRIHKELGKLRDLAGDRPHALEEYRLADRLCRRVHDDDCSTEAKALVGMPYR